MLDIKQCIPDEITEEADKQFIIKQRSKLQASAYKKIMEKKFENIINLQLKLGEGDKFLQYLHGYEAELYKRLEEKTETEFRPYIWLTLRPQNVTFKEFKKCVDKLMSKKWIKNYMYVYEQVGMTHEEVGKGFHAHFIIYKGTKKQSDCTREIHNTVKHVIDLDDKQSWRWCNINFIPEKFRNTKIKYIYGKKEYTDQNAKNIKQYFDRIFRDQNGLEQYYKSDDFEIPINLESYNDSEAKCDGDEDDI